MFNFIYNKVAKKHLREMVQHYSNNLFTLDLACGNSPLKSYFPSRIGCDIMNGSGVDVIADAHNLPFKDNSFENVVCFEALEHFHTPQKAISEIARILRPSGQLLMTTPFCYPVHEAPNDYQRFTEYGLRRLCEPYFLVDTVSATFSELQTVAILVQRIAFQKDMSIFVRWFLCSLSHFLFYLETTPLRMKGIAYQDIGRKRPGAFMTSNYILHAIKK